MALPDHEMQRIARIVETELIKASGGVPVAFVLVAEVVQAIHTKEGNRFVSNMPMEVVHSFARRFANGFQRGGKGPNRLIGHRP